MHTVATSDGVRVALVQNFRAFSQEERSNLKKFQDYWKRFMIVSDDLKTEHRFYSDCQKLVARLDAMQSLQGVYANHATLRQRESAGGIYLGLDQLA